MSLLLVQPMRPSWRPMTMAVTKTYENLVPGEFDKDNKID